MIIERPIGKLKDFAESKIDYLDIEWYNAYKKIDRLTTRNGVEVGIRLDEHALSHGLKQDDVLVQTEEGLVVVNILECECLVVDILDAHQLPKFCYEIGNRHAPFYYGEHHHQFVTPYDKPIQMMIEKLGIEVKVESVKINLEHNISSSSGGSHGHSHTH